MVKENREMLARRLRAKLILQGKSVVQFCRDNNVTYDLYKKFMEGAVDGTRTSAVKTQRLIKAIEKILGREREVTRRQNNKVTK